LKENGSAKTAHAVSIIRNTLWGQRRLTVNHILYRSSTQWTGSPELFRFRGASALDQGSLSLLVFDPVL